LIGLHDGGRRDTRRAQDAAGSVSNRIQPFPQHGRHIDLKQEIAAAA